jgi:hypothetical protein
MYVGRKGDHIRDPFDIVHGDRGSHWEHGSQTVVVVAKELPTLVVSDARDPIQQEVDKRLCPLCIPPIEARSFNLWGSDSPKLASLALEVLVSGS